MKRWIVEEHLLEDRVTHKFYHSKDKAYVDMFNVIYDELQEVKRLVKLYGEGFDE